MKRRYGIVYPNSKKRLRFSEVKINSIVYDLYGHLVDTIHEFDLLVNPICLSGLTYFHIPQQKVGI